MKTRKYEPEDCFIPSEKHIALLDEIIKKKYERIKDSSVLLEDALGMIWLLEYTQCVAGVRNKTLSPPSNINAPLK